jgi:hypothetical protein
MLPKILPWLWRLADEGQVNLQIPDPAKQQLLDAIASASGALAAQDKPVRDQRRGEKSI